MNRLIRPLILSAALLGSLCAVAAPAKRAERLIDLRATIPARIVDGEPLVATIQIHNLTRQGLEIAAPRAHVNVTPRVEFLSVANDGCLVRRAITPNNLTTATQRLLPDGATTMNLDLTGEFPVGLRPGRYRLTVMYRGTLNAASAPVEFEIVAPTDTAAYDKFRSVCSALVANRPASPDGVLAFARKQSRFPHRAALLNLARLRASGEVRAAIDRLLIEQHRSESGEAEEDLKRLERWKDADAARSRYEQAFAAELANPANAAAARELRRLGSIARPEQFDDYEQFLATHGRSFFASLVLQQMIDAVGEGVLPSGMTRVDSDRLVRGYYERLERDYPQSFQAVQAQRNPTAQRLLARSSEQ